MSCALGSIEHIEVVATVAAFVEHCGVNCRLIMMMMRLLGVGMLLMSSNAGHSPPPQCNVAIVQHHLDQIEALCCAKQDCTMGVPTVCDADCAPAFNDLWENCGEYLQSPGFVDFHSACSGSMPSTGDCNSGDTCGEHRVCVNNVCECGKGWGSDDCGDEIPYCDWNENPCLHSGACQSKDRVNFSCKCTSGYHGTKCDEKLACCKSASQNVHLATSALATTPCGAVHCFCRFDC